MEESEQYASAALLRLSWANLCQRRGSLTQAAELRARALAQLESFGCAHLLPTIDRSLQLERAEP